MARVPKSTTTPTWEFARDLIVTTRVRVKVRVKVRGGRVRVRVSRPVKVRSRSGPRQVRATTGQGYGKPPELFFHPHTQQGAILATRGHREKRSAFGGGGGRFDEKPHLIPDSAGHLIPDRAGLGCQYSVTVRVRV